MKSQLLASRMILRRKTPTHNTLAKIIVSAALVLGAIFPKPNAEASQDIPSVITLPPFPPTVGGPITAVVTVLGTGVNPTGTVTFNFYNSSDGSGPSLFSDTEPLVSGTAVSSSYTIPAIGVYSWVATYN